MMKLIIAIVQDQDQNELSRAFYDANVRATKLSTPVVSYGPATLPL